MNKIEKICPICNKKFIVWFAKRNQKYCSWDCYKMDSKSKESNIKRSETLKGRIITKEHRKKISMALKGKPKSEQAKLNMKGTKGRNNSRLKGKKCPRMTGNKNPNWTGGKIKCFCAYCGKNIYFYKDRIQSSKNLFCNSLCYHNWCKGEKQSDENILKRFLGLKKRPTKPERIFDKMSPDNVKYVGDGKWFKKLPNGKYKNPDFKVKGENKVIEIFGNYWHRKGMVYDNPQELIDLFKQIKIDCLIFWENEIYDEPELVLNRMNKFIEVEKIIEKGVKING